MKHAAALSLAGLLVLFNSAVAATLATKSGYATSFENQRKILRASSGTLALIYQKGSPISSTGGLWLALSRDGGVTWSDDLKIAAVSGVYADAHLGPGDDILLVFSTNSDGAGSSNDVKFVKLRYEAGPDRWTVERSAVVYDAGATTGAFNAVLGGDGEYVFVAYRFFDGLNYGIAIRYSADNGRSWLESLAPDDAGPDADETALFTKLENRLVLINYHQNHQLRWRWRYDADPPNVWSPSLLIREVKSFPSKSAYSAVTDAADRIHLVFSEKGVKYLRFDGTAWGTTPSTVGSSSGSYPTLASNGTDLWALWQDAIGSNQFRIVARRFRGDTQSWDEVTMQVTDASEQKAARLFAFSGADGTFTDLTSQGGNTTKGDMKHAVTGTLLRGLDDAVYFGATVPFEYLRVQLYVKGYLGQVEWEYWNGAAWVAFVPAGGPYHFTANDSVLLWADPASVPSDWATRSVNGSAALYYVRARVLVSFVTAPVGTQITSHKQNRNTTAVVDGPGAPVAAWVTGAGPYHVRLKIIDR
jgi:hypothetical protein